MTYLQHIAQAASLALAFAAAGAAQAAQITSQAALGGLLEIVDFDDFDGLSTTGPVALGAGLFFTSGPDAVLGANNQDLGTNGTWYDLAGSSATVDGKFVASAFAAGRGELGFSFAAPVAGVGAFFNQFQVAGVTSSMRLIAYDQYGNDLESFSFSIDTDEFGFNEGQFLGFQRGTADIYGFGIAGGTFVLDNLSFTSAVPEPTSWALLLGGLGAVAFVGRRRAN